MISFIDGIDLRPLAESAPVATGSRIVVYRRYKFLPCYPLGFCVCQSPNPDRVGTVGYCRA